MRRKARPWRARLHLERAKCRGARSARRVGEETTLERIIWLRPPQLTVSVRGSTCKPFADAGPTNGECNSTVVSSPRAWGSFVTQQEMTGTGGLRTSTSADDLADGCGRLETNVIYHCLLFCFQSAVARETQIILGKQKLKQEEVTYSTV